MKPITFDYSQLFPRSIQGFGDKDGARPGLADDDRITAIRQHQCRHVVAFAALVVWPAKPLVNVRSGEFVADRVYGPRVPPFPVSLSLIPAAGEHVILAIGGLDDLPVPIVPLGHGRVLQTVLLVAGTDFGGSPCTLGKRTVDRHRQKIVDEGFLRRGSRLLAETGTDTG